MLFALVVLPVILGYAFYVMSPQERVRLGRTVLAAIQQANHMARSRHTGPEPFRDALHARTPRPLVMPILVALNAAVFVFMLFGAGALGDPQTLVAWGGNFAPRTTNGEWWRLVTAMFVHAGPFHLLADLAGLVSVGLILERLVGHFAFAVVYLAAGVLASLVSLTAYPMAVSVGASGAVFGLYGLLLASAIWGVLRRSPLTIPLSAWKTLAPAAGVFVLYNLVSDSLQSNGELAGVVVGFVGGVVLARGVSEFKPPPLRVAVAAGAAAMIALAAAVPLRGVADARPEIERVIAVEARTAGEYEAAVDRFRKGTITAKALAQVIDRTIVPELQAARARLSALGGFPRGQQPMIATADEYFRLRDQSWRLRSDSLRKANMITLREADNTEKASLEALEKLKPAAQQ